MSHIPWRGGEESLQKGEKGDVASSGTMPVPGSVGDAQMNRTYPQKYHGGLRCKWKSGGHDP